MADPSTPNLRRRSADPGQKQDPGQHGMGRFGCCQAAGAIVAHTGQDRREPGLVERRSMGLRGAERGLGAPEDPP